MDIGVNNLIRGIGRVSHSSPTSTEPISNYIAQPSSNFQAEALRGIQEANPISTAFFSASNLQIIQNRVRHDIYMKSDRKYLIAPQSTADLQVIMRGIYLAYYDKLTGSPRAIIASLNDLVAIEAVKNIWTNLQQHVAYIADASTMPQPMSRPVNVSSAGTKSLPFVSFF